MGIVSYVTRLTFLVIYTLLLISLSAVMVHGSPVSYVFNGAFLEYSLVARSTVHVGTVVNTTYEAGTVTYTVSNVSSQTGVYSVTCVSSGNTSNIDPCPNGARATGSLSSPPAIFPVLSQGNVTELNQGTLPRGFLGLGSGVTPTVTVNQKISLPAGSFAVDRVFANLSQPQASLVLVYLFDMNSGILVQANITSGATYPTSSIRTEVNLTLISTNITGHAQESYVRVLILGVALVVLLAVLLVWFTGSRKKKRASIQSDNPDVQGGDKGRAGSSSSDEMQKAKNQGEQGNL